MKAFVLSNPTKLGHALDLLGAAKDPKNIGKIMPLAGGQDLFTEMKEHIAEPERLVNLKSIPGLDVLAIQGDRVALNPLVTLAAIESEPQFLARARVLAEAAHSIASPQIRSLGTIGGNLNQRPRCLYYRLEEARCLKKGGTECFSSGGMNRYNAILGGGPSYIVHPSDLAPALIALDAEVHLVSNERGMRSLALEKYYTLPGDGDITRETVLKADELLTGVTLTLPKAGSRSTYLKFKEKESYDFALSAVALRLDFEGDTIRAARLVLGGVAPIPWRVPAAEAALVGQKIDDALIEKVENLAVAGAEPLSQNAFKVPLTKALVGQALRALAKG
jgi:xanthine dehydrogenase YagS FAD-binding subunit